jgi:secreted PhoX family phosphatase
LVVNHEYTNPELMFADWDGKDESKTRMMVDIELAAHGLSVIEVQRGAKGGLELRSELVVQSPPNGRNADGAERSCGRQPAAEDFIRSERHPRARSFEQLLRRGDPLGHGAHS